MALQSCTDCGNGWASDLLSFHLYIFRKLIPRVLNLELTRCLGPPQSGHFAFWHAVYLEDSSVHMVCVIQASLSGKVYFECILHTEPTVSPDELKISLQHAATFTWLCRPLRRTQSLKRCGDASHGYEGAYAGGLPVLRVSSLRRSRGRTCLVVCGGRIRKIFSNTVYE